MDKEYSAKQKAQVRAEIEARRIAFRQSLSSEKNDPNSIAAENMHGANDMVMHNGMLGFRKDMFNSRS